MNQFLNNSIAPKDPSCRLQSFHSQATTGLLSVSRFAFSVHFISTEAGSTESFVSGILHTHVFEVHPRCVSVPSSSVLSGVPLYGSMFCSSFDQLVDIWIISTFGLLWNNTAMNIASTVFFPFLLVLQLDFSSRLFLPCVLSILFSLHASLHV